MGKRYIIALDEGTTSARTILYDVNVTQLPKVLLMVIGISGFVCFAIYKIVKNTRGW